MSDAGKSNGRLFPDEGSTGRPIDATSTDALRGRISTVHAVPEAGPCESWAHVICSWTYLCILISWGGGENGPCVLVVGSFSSLLSLDLC